VVLAIVVAMAFSLFVEVLNMRYRRASPVEVPAPRRPEHP
jgi:hypothetical protein